MKRTLISLFVLTLVATSSTGADESGWISLFDGKSLEGWKESGAKGSFTAKDGMLVAKGRPMGHLFYTGKVEGASFKDFELKLDVKSTPGSNSGIYFHTRYQPDGWPSAGFECQVNATHTDWRKSGGLYAVKDVKDVAPHKDNEWFAYHITVKGEKVVVKINGKTTVEWTQPEEFKKRPDGARKIQPGTFAIQAHDPNSVVYLKNIRVKPLK